MEPGSPLTGLLNISWYLDCDMDVVVKHVINSSSTVQKSLCKQYIQQNKLDSPLCTTILGFSGNLGWTPDTASTVHVQRRLCTTCEACYRLLPDHGPALWADMELWSQLTDLLDISWYPDCDMGVVGKHVINCCEAWQQLLPDPWACIVCRHGAVESADRPAG